MSTYTKVRRLFHLDHLSISEIQRRTSLSRNTIKAWLKETSSDDYKYPKRLKVIGYNLYLDGRRLAVFSGCDGALLAPSDWLGNLRTHDGIA